jgi:hypothetical protein
VAEANPKLLAEMKAFAEQEHEPVKAGTYLDPARTRHERDRQAKWGSARNPTSRLKGKVNQIKDKNLIPAKELKLVRSSSENRGNGKVAAHVIDGKPHTIWHTQFQPELRKHPHEIVVDLGKTRNISGFRYLARQDGGWNGAFAKTEFSISDEADSFDEEPLLETVFNRLRKAQSADLKTPVKGRYVRIRVLSEINGQPWASAAEIGFIEAK